MQVVPYAILPPGKCVECGSSGRTRKYIDTGLDIEFYGVVYICELCFTNWANQFGLGSVPELRGTISSLVERVGELEDERDSLLDVVRAIEPRSHRNVGEPTLFDESSDGVEQRPGQTSTKPSELSLK